MWNHKSQCLGIHRHKAPVATSGDHFYQTAEDVTAGCSGDEVVQGMCFCDLGHPAQSGHLRQPLPQEVDGKLLRTRLTRICSSRCTTLSSRCNLPLLMVIVARIGVPTLAYNLSLVICWDQLMLNM